MSTDPAAPNDTRAATIAAPPTIGFIGWGEESAAMLEALSRWNPRLREEALTLAGDSPHPALSRATPSLEVLFRESEVIFIDGGPAGLAPYLSMVRLAISDRQRLVMLGGGWSMTEMLETLRERKLARCMLLPTSPGTLSTLAYLTSPYFSPEERASFQAMFSGFDLCVELQEESHFDVVQGLAEFAPAAIYTILEAMADGVVMMGFPRAAAMKYLASLLHGSAGRILEARTPPGELRERALSVDVAAAGLIELESSGIRGTMMRAIQRAIQHRSHRRSQADPGGGHPHRHKENYDSDG